MTVQLIDKKYRSSSEYMVSHLIELSGIIDDPDFSLLKEELNDLATSFDNPFMFVVIGEVKSGKSSFVNSLTGEDICAVDADICTDRVQQIVYSDKPYVEHIGKYLDKKGVHAEILQDISIVDTPGTDSIIKEHEEITKRFAPNSNVIFFVFPALNPHHSSSWDMLNLMKDQWSRNIIFIAAQADRCTERELNTGIKKIEDYAREKGITDPVIFPTSSKLEAEGDSLNSGYSDVRSFITDTTRGGRHMLLKLKDRIEISEIIFDKIESKLNQRADILERDKDLRSNILSRYEKGKDSSIREIQKILERMNFVFEKVSREYGDKLKKSLSASSILKQAIPLPRFKESRHKINREFLEKILNDMSRDLERNLSREASDNAAFFIDGIKFRFSEIIREVEKARELYSREAGDRALEAFMTRRDEILTEILKGLTEMSTDLSLLASLEKNTPDIGDTVLKGSLVAAAGALLSIIAQSAVFDATGGVLSAVGILGAGGIILFKKNRMIKEFRRSLNETNRCFSDELKKRFESKMDLIFDDIYRQFEKIDAHIDDESIFIQKTSSEVQKMRNNFRKIKPDV